MNMSGKSFVSGAVILMAAGLIVRVLGFFYRIYLSNLIGAEGMGLFQLITPVYSLIILTLTSGISIAVSKMVAEEMARKHYANLRRITTCALALVAVSGIIISLLMYFKIDFITGVILKDSRTYYSILILIPCIPVIAAASALKGYFYGIQDVTPTAVSMIVEQIVRISLVMLMAPHFIGLGLEYACALATVGVLLGEISNLAVVFLVYTARRRKDSKNITGTGIMRKRKIVKGLAGISLPVSSNRFVTSLMSAAEVILIPRRLVAAGISYQESIELYGRLTGMAMPLLFFPSLVTSSLATTLVPAISEALSVKNFRSVNYRISKSIQISFVLGFIFTAIFLVFPHEIGNLVYRKQAIGHILYSFSYSCVFIYLQQILLGVLNGLGKQGISLRNSIIGYAIRIAFVYFLIPIYGIYSYVWGLVISYATVCAMDIYTVTRVTGMSLDLRNWILKPGLVGAVMVLSGKYVYGFFQIFISSHTWAVIAAVTGNAAIALFLMFAAGVLDKGDLFRLAGIKKH